MTEVHDNKDMYMDVLSKRKSTQLNYLKIARIKKWDKGSLEMKGDFLYQNAIGRQLKTQHFKQFCKR